MSLPYFTFSSPAALRSTCGNVKPLLTCLPTLQQRMIIGSAAAYGSQKENVSPVNLCATPANPDPSVSSRLPGD
ncbi:hypothetical protein AMECASPLE_007146 [Ameca splendens]|uniref:Uncharacterized protein n=1 Tax=Ameca splendens TaxID=208324 RepID=A0ABV0YAV0_9TELE